MFGSSKFFLISLRKSYKIDALDDACNLYRMWEEKVSYDSRQNMYAFSTFDIFYNKF